jgi:hypothetical protein
MYQILDFEFGKETQSQTRTFKFSEFKNGRISDKDGPCLGYSSPLHTMSKELSMLLTKFMVTSRWTDCQSAVLFQCSETSKKWCFREMA